MQKPRVARETAVVDERDLIAAPLAVYGRCCASISRMPGPPWGLRF